MLLLCEYEMWRSELSKGAALISVGGYNEEIV